MTDATPAALKPLAARDGEPAFEEPWQAQVLAIADSLVRAGLFTASQWSSSLGAALATAEQQGEADNQETYYRAALQALETLVSEHSPIDPEAMAQMRNDWEAAYRRTPHGQPVLLEPDPSVSR